MLNTVGRRPEPMWELWILCLSLAILRLGKAEFIPVLFLPFAVRKTRSLN